MPIVRFVKEHVEIEVPVGANLRTAARRAGINLNQGVNGVGARLNKYLNCGGAGLCGTCRVIIRKGMENTNPLTVRERLKFKLPCLPAPVPDPISCVAYLGHEEVMRLACMTRVFGDIEVLSGPEFNLFGEEFPP